MLKYYIRKYHRVITIVVAVLLFVSMAYYGIQANKLRGTKAQSKDYAGNAMGTAVKKTLYMDDMEAADEVNRAINKLLTELEAQISVRIPESEVAGLNRNYAVDGIYHVSENIVDYLEQELIIYKETDGAFSPCIRPLSVLWGIEDGNDVVPSAEAVQSVLPNIDGSLIETVGEDGITLHAENMAIDFGAIGKGIACDQVEVLLGDSDVRGAVVSIGGSILAYGDKGDGKDWHIAIQDPRKQEGSVLGILDVKGGTKISTSGDYEKYFEQDGKRYHHIFDPATGYPAESGLISVTIISDNGLLSDAMSTACFVMGLQKGMEYVEEKGVEAVFVTTDKKVYVSSGIKKRFRLQAKDFKMGKMENDKRR